MDSSGLCQVPLLKKWPAKYRFRAQRSADELEDHQERLVPRRGVWKYVTSPKVILKPNWEYEITRNIEHDTA